MAARKRGRSRCEGEHALARLPCRAGDKAFCGWGIPGPFLHAQPFLSPAPETARGPQSHELQELLAGSEAETMQALPNMLEIVPRGWNKWTALQILLDDMKVGS